jgi:hypothetical protein
VDERLSQPAVRRRFLRGWRRIAGLVVLGLLLLGACLPWIAGPFVPGFAARAFAERFQGRLEIGSAGLSWFGSQSLQGCALLDPEGREVARLDLELPGLWPLARGGGRVLGTIRAELRAALVADEQGLTNLERALAPRKPAPPGPAGAGGERGSAAAAGPEPELELELHGPLCSWSDARTRAAGQAFEVRDLRLHLALHEGQPALLEARAQLAGEQPGGLELDARVDGLRTQGGFGFAKARARGKVQGFSSAMLDGLAQQRGRLEQVLGPRFDLSFELADLGPSSGTFSCALQSERTHLALEGRVQDGLLRFTDQRGLALELGEPRAFVESYLAPHLPPGTQLVWPATAAPWKLECAALTLPLPGASPAGGAELGALLARAEVDARLSIPGPLGFRNEFTRGIDPPPALSAIGCRITSGAGRPLALALDAQLSAGEKGTLHAELQAAEPWTALARGELPVLDGRIELQGLSNATLDALLGRDAFLAEGLGRALDLRVALEQASLAGGKLEARAHSANLDLELHGRIEGGKLVAEAGHGLELHWAPPPGWVERQLAPLLPPQSALRLEAETCTLKLLQFSLPLRAADLDARLAETQASCEVDLPGLRFAFADGRSLGIADSLLSVSLGRGGRCALRFDTHLVQASPAHCVLQGDFPALGDLLRGELPPLSFDLTLEQVDTLALDPWLTGDRRLPPLLGERLDLKLRAEQLGLRSGTLELLLHSLKLDARLALAGDKGVWRSTGGAADQLRLALARADLERELGPYLPAGTELELDPQSSALVLQLHELSLAVPSDPARLFEGLRAKLELALPGCSFSNELTRQAGIRPSLAEARLQAELADQGELALAFDARIGGAGDARLHAEARGSSLAAARAALRIEGLPCSVADALLGRPAALSGLLGEKLDLSAELARGEGGTGQLDFALRAPHGEASASGRLEPGAFVLAEPQGLHLRLEPTDAWLAQALPGLKRAAGEPKPFDLHLHSERIGLPQGAQTWLAALSESSARLEAALPDLGWSEASGAALELRGLELRAELSRAPGSALHFRGSIAGDPPGELGVELRALDALTLLAEEGGPERFRVALQVHAQGLPVGLVDALAGQGGMLVEGLGARADLRLESAGLSREAGAFVLDLDSPQGPAHFDGELREGQLRVFKPKGLTAHFSLGPLSSTRFVGRLVPLVCELSKPSGASPASLEVDALTLPLDGDLSKLDGLLRLDLGEVSYAILPGMKGLFGSQAGQKAVHLPAFTVPIQKGVVRYDKLLLPIGGRELAFHGSFSLVDGALQLGTEIPLELLGPKVNSELDKARGLIDGKTLVPIEIRGTWDKPHFAVGSGFLDSVVKKALGGALEKGLDGLFKKKPKKE